MILLREPVCAASSQMSFLPVDAVTLITSDKKSRWATMLNMKQTHNGNEKQDRSRKNKGYAEKTDS